MKRTVVQLDWNFNDLITGSPGLPQAHTFYTDEVKIPTGAGWRGDHGIVMELCKVQFKHAFDMREGDAQWVVLPSGVVWDRAMGNSGSGADHYYSVCYNTTLSIGEGHNNSPVNAFRDDLAVAEARCWTTATCINTQANARMMDTGESGLEWDLTDGAGNGTLVAATEMTLEGVCRTKSSETARDAWPKRLQPPFGRCNKQIGATNEYSYHPVTECLILYKLKRVTMQDWYSLSQEQSKK